MNVMRFFVVVFLLSYGKSRPSLCVTILPYFNALTEEGLKQVPYVYLRDVIRFESHVASCKYDGL